MDILQSRPWFIDGLLVAILAALFVVLIWAVMKLAGEHVRVFLDYLKREPREFKAGRSTLGSINWRCVRFLFFFGFVIIAALETKMILTYVGKLIGMQNAEYFYKSADIVTMFFVLSAVVIVSVLAVYANSRK